MDAIATGSSARFQPVLAATVPAINLGCMNGISRFVNSMKWPITDIRDLKLSLTLFKSVFLVYFRSLSYSVTLLCSDVVQIDIAACSRPVTTLLRETLQFIQLVLSNVADLASFHRSHIDSSIEFPSNFPSSHYLPAFRDSARSACGNGSGRTGHAYRPAAFGSGLRTIPAFADLRMLRL